MKKSIIKVKKKIFKKFFLKKIYKQLIKCLFLFFYTHNISFFLKTISFLFQNKKKGTIFRIITFLKNINKKRLNSILKFFDISGLYFKFSGKLGGRGGSKKLKQFIVFGKPNISNYNVFLKRNQIGIWSYNGYTNISVYTSFFKKIQ